MSAGGGWIDHLLLHSIGLAVVGLLVLCARLLLRRDPVLCYRILVGALLGILVVPVLQVVAQRLQPRTPARARDLAVKVLPRLPRSDSLAAESLPAPRDTRGYFEPRLFVSDSIT